ncbi:transposase [bacterium]|nr:MAG: transposase [bacterium]
MRHLDGLYTQRYNRRHKRDGPLFRGRYKAIVVDAEEYLLAVARYIHHNPVAAGLVQSPEFYKWSSCRVYLGPRKKPRWLDAEQLLSRFPKQDRQRAFLVFMRSKVEEPLKSFYDNKRWVPVLGSKAFIESIRGQVRKRQTNLKEVPEAKPYIRPDCRACLDVVERAYGSTNDELMRSRRGQRNEARAMAMYLCRRVAGMKHEEIAKVFGLGGYSAVSSVIGRIQVELEKGGKIVRRYKQIRDLFQR